MYVSYLILTVEGLSNTNWVLKNVVEMRKHRSDYCSLKEVQLPLAGIGIEKELLLRWLWLRWLLRIYWRSDKRDDRR